MFPPQLGSALLRLICLAAFALSFSGVARAQQQQVLSLTAQPALPEGSPASFRVTLSNPATQRLTFRFATSAGTGPTGARSEPGNGFDRDFGSFSEDFTLEVGATELIIPVTTVPDNSYEFDESFSASIFAPRYNGQDASATVTIGQATATNFIINDDSPPAITLSTPDPILEGDTLNRAQQNYNFTVNIGNTLAEPDQEVLGRPISLAFTTIDGTAVSGGANPGTSDFVPASANVVQVPAGTRQFQYTVIVNGDDVYEGDETFSLRVEYSPPLANTTASTAVGTIRDNDLPTYRIDTTDPDARAIVEEGQNTVFIVKLLDRQGNEVPALTNIPFAYSVQNVTATLGTDYTDPNNGAFTIPKGSSRFRLEFPTVDDNAIEQTETFRFIITSAVGTRAPEGNGANVGIGTILDTADNNAGTLLTIQDATVNEGTGGLNNIQFTVNLTRATGQSVSVSYATADSIDSNPAARATAGVDYTPTSGRLTFAPNETVRTFTVPITTDSINELDENFRVRLFNPINATFANNAEEIFARATILDDDVAGIITVARADVDVPEDVAGGFVNVLVNFTPTPGTTQVRPVTVDFTTLPDTAQQVGQRDYFGKAGTLTFRPGVSQQIIPVEIVDDNIREGNETFTVRLSNPNGATLGAQAETRVTILDDDPLPTVSVNPAAPVSEAAGVKNFVVVINGRSQAPITVNYNFADGTATNGLDYQGTAGSLTFNPGGPVSFFVSATILEDEIAEGNETFSLVLSKDPQDNSFSLPQATATSQVVIVDNDRTPEITIGDARIDEGNTGSLATGNELVFPVTLSRANSRPVSFVYSTLNLRQPDCVPANGCDVAANNDYAVARNLTLTLAPGQTTAEIRVRVAPDTLNELNEQFAIVSRSLTNAVPAVYTDANNGTTRFGTTAFGTILNDDAGGNITIAAPVSPEGTAITAGIAEGYNRGPAIRLGDVANFVVTLPAPAGRPLTVNYTINSGVAQGEDVQDLTTGPGRTGAGTGSITFFNGDTRRIISLRAAPDNLVEGSEKLQVVLSINDNNGANSYTTNGALTSTTILDRTPGVNTVVPTIGFPAYGTVAATRVTINGTQLRTENNPRVDAVLFNNVAVGRGAIQYLSDNSIAVSVPDNAKTGPLRLRLVDGTIVSKVGLSNATPEQPIPDFVVQPVITGFAPATGVVNASTVSINGRNFQDANNPVTAVQFTGTIVNVGQGATVINDNRIDVVVPQGAVSGPLRIVSTRGGAGPASLDSFAVVGATAGSITLGDNPDRNAILEGSTGNISQPVRNVDGTGDSTYHRPYLFFVNPPRQSTGANVGAPLPLTQLTVRFQISASAGGGRNPQIAVRADLTNAGRPTFLTSSTNGIVDVNLDSRFNTASPIEVAIVDAGTDNVAPIVGGTSPTVTVAASISASANPTFFPVTPAGQETAISVSRVEPVTGNNQTAIAYGPGTRANFSVPFAVNNTTSVAITDVFDTPPVVGGVRRYTIYRFNVANQTNKLSVLNGEEGADFVAVPDNGRLERGLGYRLVVGAQATVQLKTKGAGLVSSGVRSFAYNLTRNVPLAATANNATNATNGYNFIGFPFNPAQFQNVEFNQATVTFNGVNYSVPDAVAAGLIGPQLLTLNEQGTLSPASTTVIMPFQAYFVQIFRDNVTLTLQNPTP